MNRHNGGFAKEAKDASRPSDGRGAGGPHKPEGAGTAKGKAHGSPLEKRSTDAPQCGATVPVASGGCSAPGASGALAPHGGTCGPAQAPPHRRNPNRATATQAAAISALAEAKGIGREALEGMLSEDFGAERADDLTAHEASRLYEALLCMEETRR